jgi:thymidylate synthase (FAD)
VKVELWEITRAPEIFIARCARVSRGKYEAESRIPLEDARDLIRRLIKKGHESVLEHAWATFYIDGISRVCLAQLTRHRIASYTVESQRFVTPKKTFVIPPSFEKPEDPSVKAMVEAYLETSQVVFENLLASGIPKEDARFMLPQAITTSLVMTANFREWRHILKLRTAPEAQWEIRALCTEIGKILMEHAPSAFEDIMEGK